MSQEARITGLQAASTSHTATINQHTTQIASLQSLVGTAGSRISAIEDQQATLFDLANQNNRGIRKSNEGVAMALALDTPAVPAGARFAMSGGIGYFNGQASFASAFSAAVGEMSSVSAGVGYGIRSNEVGARAGFQIAW